MDDVDPLDSDEFDAATPAQGGSPATGSPFGIADGMGSAVENALGALDVDALVADAATAVVTKLVNNLAKEALSAALPPARLEQLQERTATAVERAVKPSPPSEDATTADETVYGSVDEWLRKYWRFTYRRRVSAKGSGTGRWKAEWWNTDEAVQRLETLWRGWEAARLDPGLGTSAWWINHAAPHMTALLAVDGPFADSRDENQVGEPLPYERPPEHLFPPDKQP
ncbi:DUF4913 domain-containing protein [Microbacterium enclense]|uniref:DUF4913 domain-containing protein n=1 Tax=Microbacterium enclense TaxID=993073 RepID=A0A1G6RF28_9MICO|nr:DUF4913 domain-containing protein [Microbacterium enclense]KSU51585.1 hypothetical protein AS029_16210 [Microbacterium enclense]SDD03260.1 protein of unknown function [Microbacterium enclense]